MDEVKYEIEIADSVLNLSHGFIRKIKEVFIPEEKIIFNIVDGELHVWFASEPRCSEKTKVQEITLDRDFVKQLKVFMELKEKCITKAKNYFEKKQK